MDDKYKGGKARKPEYTKASDRFKIVSALFFNNVHKAGKAQTCPSKPARAKRLVGKHLPLMVYRARPVESSPNYDDVLTTG